MRCCYPADRGAGTTSSEDRGRGRMRGAVPWPYQFAQGQPRHCRASSTLGWLARRHSSPAKALDSTESHLAVGGFSLSRVFLLLRWLVLRSVIQSSLGSLPLFVVKQ
jgi:hypothetical protein